MENADKTNKLPLYSKNNEYNFTRILKANSIIYARRVKTNLQKLNIGDQKTLNFLLRILQETIRQNQITPVGNVSLKFPADLYQIIDDTRNWRINLKNRLKKLVDSKIELYDYYDPDKKVTYKYRGINCVASADLYVDEKGNATVDISFPKELATAQMQKQNYTHLEFKTINAFKSKYALAFYEILVSKIQYYVNNDWIKAEYDINQEELEKILEMDLSNHKGGFKHALQSILFNDVVLKDLQQYLPCEVKIYSKDKKITFMFEEEIVKHFITKSLSEYDLAMKQFQDLIHSSIESEGKVHFSQIGNSKIETITGTSYKIDNDSFVKTLEKFMIDICKYYSNRSLIPSDKRAEFGDVIMTSGGKFVERGTFKPLSYKKKIKVLKYLYKYRYNEIVGSINLVKKTKVSETIDNLFKEYINLYLVVSDGFLKIKSIGKATNKTEDVSLNVCFEYYKELDDLIPQDRKYLHFKNLIDFNEYVTAHLYKKRS